jgi:hypothetical protein
VLNATRDRLIKSPDNKIIDHPAYQTAGAVYLCDFHKGISPVGNLATHPPTTTSAHGDNKP